MRPGTKNHHSARWPTTVAAGAVAGLLAVAAVGCASDDPATAQSVPPTTTSPAEPVEQPGTARSITVTGEGRVTVKPDIAHVQMGVQVSGRSAGDVLDEANAKAAALIEALKGLGVADDDITTSGISIYPQYDSNGNTITGYQASNSLDVTIRDIAQTGVIIDGGAAFAGEAITIGGISFSVADPEAVVGEARADAIANAKKRAGEYAAAAGAEVGKVLTISEIGISSPVPFYRTAAADEAGGVPIQTGTTDLTASVTVVFELL